VPARPSFDYAVIRVVPRVEREEFVNAGVIVSCPEARFLEHLLATMVRPPKPVREPA
jgi:hypothetical protein